jgi:DNA-binding CsgD family transcriptional regulator/PAS domain-containing protein
MISVEAFSDLLQMLYSAPLHQEQWQRFLTHLCKYTGFSSGFFFTASIRTGFVEITEGGTLQDRIRMQDYYERHARQDPFRTAVIEIARRRDPAGIYSEEDMIPEEKYLAHRIFREVHVPMNFRYCALIAINISLRRLEAISIWRSEREGPLEPESRRFLEMLLPHIRTALEFRQALGEAHRQLTLAQLLTNANPDPVFALRADGRIESTNAAGESLLRTSDGLTSVGRKLVAVDHTQAAEVSALLSSSGRSNVLALRRTGRKRPLQLIATPLALEDRRTTRADVLLLVSDPDKPILLPDETLRSLFSFTPAETAIANGLLIGYSPAEISCLRRVAASTVRQQVKTMLQKTNCPNQAAMVRLLMTLPQENIPAAG